MKRITRRSRRARRKQAASSATSELTWHSDGIHCSFRRGNAEFFAEWVNFEGKERCGVELRFARGKARGFMQTLKYTSDPRKNPKRLNADILEAVDRWLKNHPKPDSICPSCGDPSHYTEDPGSECFKFLKQTVARPIVCIRDIDTLDSIILGLTALRGSSAYLGGSRGFLLSGDLPGPQVWVDTNLSTQAADMKGQAPPIGSKIGNRIRVRKESNGGSKVTAPDSSMVQELLDQLEAATDSVTKRKIRGQLRKLGHKGGGRKAR